VTLYLHGMGHYQPETELSNRFLAELDIGTTEEWIVERVGIRTRRTVLPLDYIRQTRNRDLRAAAEAAQQSNAELAACAAELALRRAGIGRERIGLVVSGSSAPRVVTPAEASFVAKELGIEAPVFDLNSACSTFTAQLYALSLMNPSALPEFVLLTQQESLTTALDYTDRGSCILFGDGAAAAVVSTQVPAPVQLSHLHLASDPQAADKVMIERCGYFEQDGRAVQMFAIKRTRDGFEHIRSMQQQEGGSQRPLHFIGHQANLRVLEQVCKRCNIPPELHHSNVETCGNMGGASAPSALSMHWEKFTPQDDIALVTVGGGLSWTRALLRFGQPS